MRGGHYRLRPLAVRSGTGPGTVRSGAGLDPRWPAMQLPVPPGRPHAFRDMRPAGRAARPVGGVPAVRPGAVSRCHWRVAGLAERRWARRLGERGLGGTLWAMTCTHFTIRFGAFQNHSCRLPLHEE
jgi:hypothetical protein